MSSEQVPSHVAGYTIMRTLRLGVFGADYLGHSNEGLRLLKVLREGEGLAIPEEAYAALKDDAQLLHFHTGQTLSQDQRVVTAHTVQAAAFGVLVGGSPLQNECLETTREFDMDQKVASTLRATTLVQKAQLLLQVAQVLERLHKEGKTFPYLTPWNVLLEADQPKLAEVGLGLRPDDPKFDAGRISEDVLVYLAPEVLRAVNEKSVVQVSPAADVYALAATARSVLLNRVADPAAGPSPAASRREAVLKAAGLKLDAHQSFSRELEALLRAALSVDPTRRPAAAAFAAKLHELIQGGKIAYTPPPVWPIYAGIGSAVAVALIVFFTVILPIINPPGLLKARLAYAQATRTSDLAAREEALKTATLEKDGATQPLPEAARLLAVTRFQRWARSQKDPAAGEKPGAPDAAALDAVLAGLEKDVVTGHDDALAHTARFIVAVLRRWEVGGEARKAADAELEALSKPEVRPEPLRDLAAAARALTATGAEKAVDKAQLEAWSESANNASLDAGFLGQEYTFHPDDYAADGDIPEKPVGVSLDAAWLGRLIAGRLQGLLDRHLDARGKLSSARSVSIFATNAAYGLELAQRGTEAGDPALARQVLELATARRGPFAEGLLALGRIELRTAHDAKSAEAYTKAVEVLQQATGAPADTPGADIAKQALTIALEARLYEAAALVVAGEPLDAAERKVADLLKAIDEAGAEAQDRLGPDARLARGVLKLKKNQPAQDDLSALFKAGAPGEWAQLPDLRPEPATRLEARGKAIGAIAGEKLALCEALSAAPKREEVAAAEKAIEDVLRLVSTPEAKAAMDMARVHLARAKVLLGKYRTSDGRTAEEAMAQAQQAFADALDAADLKSPEGAKRWFEAVKGKIASAYTVLDKLGQNPDVEKLLPLLRQAKKDLGAFAASVPRAIAREWDPFKAQQEKELRTQFLGRIEAWAETRKQDWSAIDIKAPKYPEEEATQEIAVLDECLGLFREDGRYDVEDAKDQLRVATLLRWLSLLERAKRLNPKVYEHSIAALELVERLDAQDEPRVEPLRDRLNFALGWLALNEGASLANVVNDAKAFGYDALARAAGARDFSDLKGKAGGRETFTPRMPEAVQAIAADIVATYEAGPLAVPADPKPGQEIKGARDVMSKMDFATKIDRQNPGAFLILARVQFSIGADQFEPAFRNAERAYQAAQAAGPAGLAVLVQASRLYCYARSQMPQSDEAVAGQEFRMIATRGRDAARDLFARDAGAQSASYHHGPAYWVAKSFYVKGQQLRGQNKKQEAIAELEQAVRAYDEFERGIQGRDAPAEAAAADFKREKANATNLLRVLRQG